MRRAASLRAGAVAGLAPTTEADLGDGTFAGARLPRRARHLWHRQRLEHLHRSVRRAAAARVVAAPVAAGTQRARDGGRAGRPVAVRGGGARGSARDGTAGRRDRRRMPCRFRGARRERSGPCSPARHRAAGRRGLRTVPCPGARCHGGRAVGRARGSPPPRRRGVRPLPCVSGSIAVVNTAFDLLITGAHLATMEGTAPYGAIRDGAIGIVGGTIAWVGAERDLPRDVSAQRSLHAQGAWATPGIDRLPYASRLRRRSRRRVRGAPQRRHLRGDRAGGRRHQGHRQGDPRGERGGAGRGEPIAARGAGGRRRDDGRDQVRLRTRHRDRMPAAPRGPAPRGRDRRRRADHVALRARRAAGVRRARRRRMWISFAARSFPRRRRPESPTPSMRSARRSASRRRRRGASSKPRGPTGCR